MEHRTLPIFRLVAAILLVATVSFSDALRAAEVTGTVTIRTEFAPVGDPTDLAVSAIDNARHRVLVAAYSFTSTRIAKALVSAHQRGVRVRVVLDAGQNAASYSGGTFLANAGIETLTNDRYRAMHHKFLVIDDATVALGSFNFTKAGQDKNRENFNVISGSKALAASYVTEWNAIAAEGKRLHPKAR